MRGSVYLRLMCGLWVMIAYAASGCGYPEVSPQAYELSKAMYSACNQKDEARLAKLSDLIIESREEGEITEKEAMWLNEMIAQARASDWEAATAEARAVMEAQVE